MDDVPAYVIENDKGKQQVLHRARLLLWSSCDNEQEGLQMTAAQLNIFVSMSALEPLPDGEERCRVPYEWSFVGFGLSLACYEPMLEASSLKTGMTPLWRRQKCHYKKELANGKIWTRKTSLLGTVTLFSWGTPHLEVGHA